MNFHWIDPEFHTKEVPPPIVKVRRELTNILLLIYCRKNRLNGTKHLALPGNYLMERIDRRLDDTDLPIISEFLSNNHDVVSLELSYNNFSSNELGSFMDNLIDDKSPVHYLGLMNCGLGIEELEILAETVGYTKIDILRINDNNFGRNASKYVELMICNQSSNLTVLDLGNIGADWGLVSTLAGALLYPHVNIQVLDISRIVPNSFVSVEHSDMLAELIEVVIGTCHTIKELHARHNSLDGQDLEMICKATLRAKNLLYVDLAYNKIGDKGAEYFAETLHQRPALIGLNLSANHIGEIGGRALGHAIPHSVLRMLDVSLNKMRVGGLRILLHCLKKPHKMRILSVWGNDFDNDAAAVVYRMQISGVLQDDCIDVRAVYENGIYRVAEKTNSSHMLRHRYYLVHVPPVNPMDPYLERERKLKIDFTHVRKLPRPDPCPSGEIALGKDEEDAVPESTSSSSSSSSFSSSSSSSSDDFVKVPKTPSPCDCRSAVHGKNCESNK